MPPPSFTGPTGGRVCPARYVNCPARRGGYHPPASVGATCGRPSAGVPPGTRPMGPPRRPNGVVVVGRGGPAEGMSFRACPEANDPQLGPTTAPPFLPKEMGEKKGRGLCPLDPPNGGSWRRWVIRTGQRPAAHRRPFSWHLCHRRCRAPGCTHRDYPAGPDSRRAVSAWPAGPPSVPCR